MIDSPPSLAGNVTCLHLTPQYTKNEVEQKSDFG